jgi:hypothetical protein
MDAGLSGDCRYWLAEAARWPCTCRGAELFLCDRCLIHTSLAAAAAAVDQRRWSVAHRAARRAAGIDGRLVPLRDRLEALAFVEREGAMAQDTMYSCGRTFGQHKELLTDVVIREQEFRRDQPHHEDDEEAGIHVHKQYVTCLSCNSTFTYPLPGDDEGARAEVAA